MKRRIFQPIATVIAIALIAQVAYATVTLVSSKWSNGALQYYKVSDGTELMTIAPAGVTIPTLIGGASIDLSSSTAGVLADGDALLFLDATDSNLTKKEALDDVATLFAGTGLTATSSVLAVTLPQRITINFGTGGEDTDGAFTNGGGVLGGSDTTDTEAGATYCATYDQGNTEFVQLSTSSSGTDVTNDYQFFSDTKGDNDAVYFGAAAKFCEVGIDMSATVQNYTGDALTWEYADSATPTWATLTLQYDNTDATAQDGKRSFGRDGAISFIPPAGWTASQPDAVLAADGFYIRARISTTANMDTNEGQTNSVQHYTITPNGDAQTSPISGTITSIRVVNTNDTVHNQNIEFLLWNVTQSTWSSATAHTWTASQQVDLFGSLTLAVTAGDVLGVIILDDNAAGANPQFNVELSITPG